jgi:hypothetical protein
LEEYTHICDGCEERHYASESQYINDCVYCPECASDNSNEVPTIKIPFTKINSNGFKINKYKNLCGVEIECLNDELLDECFDFDDLVKYQFSQVYDGSLDQGSGVEFVSNAFNGDCLLFNIRKFCDELNKRSYYVDRSCGLHIHIAINKRLEFIKKVYAFYSIFEDMFFRMLPKSRQSNLYCYKFSRIYPNITLDNIKACTKSLEFQKLLYDSKSWSAIKSLKKDKYNRRRYGWINFHSLFYRGTLEIRNHSGSINYDKIKNWLLIHLRVLNFIKHLSFETICVLPKTDEFFLSLFDDTLNKYIRDRWAHFDNPYVEEED